MAADDTLSTKVLLVVVGALGTLAVAAFKSYLDRRSEVRKAREEVRRDYLDPLRVAAKDLRSAFANTFTKVASEKDKLDSDLHENYNLRYWFRRAKNYIVGPEPGNDDERRRDFAMHSGGVGCEADSTLYLTACYLYYATRIRLKSPYIQIGRDDQALIARIDDVRAHFSVLDFYAVTQDSTGISMRNSAGEIKNYREFGEALTSRSEGAWFMTLTDVYFKLYWKPEKDVQAFLASVDRLIAFLDQTLPAR